MTSIRSVFTLFGLLLVFSLSKHANAQQSCPSLPTYCHSNSFCTGVNTGFFSYWTLDRPFIDQARGSGLSVSGYTPDSVVRNSTIPLDANKYPTDTGRTITLLFNASTATTHQDVILPAGQYVILWDGAAVNPDAKGGGASGVIYNPGVNPNRIEFTFDPNPVANTWFSYENAAGGHVTNIRIVPLEYEADYANWSWDSFQVGAAGNPPIFFPEWLEKMSSGCVIRYTQAVNTNDQDAVFFERDSSSTRIFPSNSVWFQGFNLGSGAFGPANQSHIWPWELIVEATLQTQTIPWINFRAYTYENLVGVDGVFGTADDDSLVSDVASLFGQEYGGAIYVEYGNEIWNYGWPFNVATTHIEANGPGTNSNLEENYTLRSNAIQEAFADGYNLGGADSCDALGVLASQARAPGRIQSAVTHADLDYIDVLSAASYVGGDVNPQSTNTSYVARWDFVSDLYDDVQSATKTQNQAFAEISSELLTGSGGLVAANWQNDLIGHLSVFKSEADASPKTCLAIYESGLHWRLDGLDLNDTQHMGVADFMRDYHRSQELADVEIEMNNWFINNDIGPTSSYTNFMSAGWGTFSYWDWVFEDVCSQAPRAAMIGAYSSGTTLPIGQHPNQAPSISTVPNQTSFVADSINFQLPASDPQNDTITYSASGLPPTLTLDSVTGLITGTTDTVGGYTVTAEATDEHGLTSCSPAIFDWTVASQNTATPEISSPVPQSTLTGSTEIFSWTDNGAGVTDWWIYAGSVVGGTQYFNSNNIGTQASVSVTGLPVDGSTVFVRLWYRLSGSSSWLSIDETYTAAQLQLPEITSPVPPATLTGETENFSWTANGQNVTDWWVYAGSVAGGKQYFDSGTLPSSTTSITATGLPVDGSDVHITLWYKLNGAAPWITVNYVYTAAVISLPEVTQPVPGTVLTSDTENFIWVPNAITVSDWWIYAGSTVRGSQYFSSGSLASGVTNIDVTGLPTDGSLIHVTLWYRESGSSTWTSVGYTYTAATIAAPEVLTPVPGSTLTGSTVTFTWTDNAVGVAEWWLYAGSTVSGKDHFDSGNLGSVTTIPVTGLPGGGNTVHVTLWYRLTSSGSWDKKNYIYTSN